MLGISRALVPGFISDLQVERGKRWKFLRYKATYSQIYYWDMDTDLFNNSNDVRFDEGMNNLDIQTTNYINLQIYLG